MKSEVINAVRKLDEQCIKRSAVVIDRAAHVSTRIVVLLLGAA